MKLQLKRQVIWKQNFSYFLKGLFFLFNWTPWWYLCNTKELPRWKCTRIQVPIQRTCFLLNVRSTFLQLFLSSSCYSDRDFIPYVCTFLDENRFQSFRKLKFQISIQTCSFTSISTARYVEEEKLPCRYPTETPLGILF